MIFLLTTILVLYGIFVFFAVFSKSTTVSIISYSAISSAVFFIYYIYNAADVALTEISIGMFLTFFFFYITHHKTGNTLPEKQGIISIFLIGACVLVLFIMMLYVGYLLETISLEQDYSVYYNSQSHKQTQIVNTITAILASYRGFDTMGETLIIATSSLGIATILQGKKKM